MHVTTEMKSRMSTEVLAERADLCPGLVDEIRAAAVRCGVQKIILFGSRARGSNSKYSDIDLACRGGDVALFAMVVDEETSTALKFDVVDLDRPISRTFRAAISREGVPLW